MRFDAKVKAAMAVFALVCICESYHLPDTLPARSGILDCIRFPDDCVDCPVCYILYFNQKSVL